MLSVLLVKSSNRLFLVPCKSIAISYSFSHFVTLQPKNTRQFGGFYVADQQKECKIVNLEVKKKSFLLQMKI